MSRRERLAVFGFALFVAGGLVPLPAAAVSFLQVSYSVTGGTFNGPNLTGPITGGVVSYITNPGVTYLPVGYQCNVQDGCGFITQVQLQGPAGTFALVGSAPLDFLARSAPTGIPNVFARASGLTAALRSGTTTPDVAWVARNTGAYGLPIWVITAYPHVHLVDYGAEVLTVVPEPASATLLGVGLLGLAIGGGMRQLRRR